MERTCHMTDGGEHHTFDDSESNLTFSVTLHGCTCGKCSEHEVLYFCSEAHFIHFAYNMSQNLESKIKATLQAELLRVRSDELDEKTRQRMAQYKREAELLYGNGMAEAYVVATVDLIDRAAQLEGAKQDDSWPGQYL